MRPHGNRASSLFRRWRQRGGGKGKQNRGRWRNKRRKRWRENRYLLSFHREDLKSEPPSWPGRRREEGGRAGWWGQWVQGWGGRMPGLLLSLGPGSAMAPKPLLSGAVGRLWWWGVSCCEVHFCFLHSDIQNTGCSRFLWAAVKKKKKRKAKQK